MVSWENIANACQTNPYHSICVDSIPIPSPNTIDRYPLLTQTNPQNVVQMQPTQKPRIETPVQNLIQKGILKGIDRREIDPILLNMHDTIELYDSSSYAARKQLECEEAIRIEGLLKDLYKSESGRSRGWTKVGLESLIQARCASGGDIKELSKSKKAFPWPLVADDKLYSAFLDFLCLAKNIRCAVWFEDEKHVVVYPAADRIGVDAASKLKFPLYNVSSKGIALSVKIQKCDQLVQYCDANQWILMPPASIFHTLSTLTLSEMDSVGEKIGCTDLQGSKKERIAKLASYKLRQRLT